MNLADAAVLRHEREFPGRLALVVGDAELSFGELGAGIRGLAGWLHAAGLPREGVVLVDAVNSFDVVQALFGVIAAGGCAFLVDRSTSSEELTGALRGEPVEALVVVGEDLPAWAVALKTNRRLATPAAAAELGAPSLGEALTATPVDEAVAREHLDPVVILLTSGTTAVPKAAVLSHGELLANARTTAQTFGLTRSDVGCVFHPLANILNLSSFLAHIDAGGAVLVEPGLTSPPKLLGRMGARGVTGFSCVPSAIDILRKGGLPRAKPPSLRYVRIGGLFSTAQLAATAELLPGVALYKSYGMTESGLVSMLRPNDADERRGSVGRPYPAARARIVDDEGRVVASAVRSSAGAGTKQPDAATGAAEWSVSSAEVGGVAAAGAVSASPAVSEVEGETGVEGEIVVDGAHPMLRYLRNPEATGQVLRADGIHTGDRGLIDEAGYLHFRGRQKDLIKVSGESIWAETIEAAILRHPEVREVAVIGAPNRRLGEAPWGFVVPEANAELSERDLMRHARYHLEPRQVPVGFVVVEELPLTRTHKIRRGTLAALLPDDHESR